MHENKKTALIKDNLLLASIDEIELPQLKEHDVGADMLRLDRIHPVVSGNKWYKLKEHLQNARKNGNNNLITFGGPWSNHIIATAYAAKAAGLSVTGIIRGEKAISPSATLQAASGYGMQLEFVSREDYKRKEEPAFLDALYEKFPGVYIIPEGGAGWPGIKGSEDILQGIERNRYTHILCALGTGTMFLGLANASLLQQTVIGIPVLKGLSGFLATAGQWLESPEKINYCKINDNYHFGGYAKKTDELLDFMNRFYRATGIPSDFVYTGKLFYAAFDMVNNNYFPAGSRLLLIHSGGLQGNQSLSPGVLDFGMHEF